MWTCPLISKTHDRYPSVSLLNYTHGSYSYGLVPGEIKNLVNWNKYTSITVNKFILTETGAPRLASRCITGSGLHFYPVDDLRGPEPFFSSFLFSGTYNNLVPGLTPIRIVMESSVHPVCVCVRACYPNRGEKSAVSSGPPFRFPLALSLVTFQTFLFYVQEQNGGCWSLPLSLTCNRSPRSYCAVSRFHRLRWDESVRMGWLGERQRTFRKCRSCESASGIDWE